MQHGVWSDLRIPLAIRHSCTVIHHVGGLAYPKVECELMQQVRPRTYAILPYRDAILSARARGITWVVIVEALQRETGVDWNVRQLSYLVHKYLVKDTDAPQRALPALTNYDVTSPASPRVEVNHPPVGDRQLAPSHYPTPSTADVGDAPLMPASFSCKDFNVYRLEPGTLVGDPVRLPDGATAQWGCFRERNGRERFECDISNDIIGVRFGKRNPGAPTIVWPYTENENSFVSVEPTLSSIAHELRRQNADKGTPLVDRPFMTLGQYEHVEKWYEWFVKERIGA